MTSPPGPGFITTKGSKLLVTGASGLVGARLVEMLLERGASKVVCFDVMEPSQTLLERYAKAAGLPVDKNTKVELYSGLTKGNLTNKDSLLKACAGVDTAYHIAALVGPFHDRDKYFSVNVQGTKNLIEACKANNVKKLVSSSSPSTRFHMGKDVTGQTEDELTFPDKYVALYAETKAYAEKAVTEACCDELLTVNIAPHQVYGPYDSLFLPSLLETSGNGKLRVFGRGDNKISVCYNDNYCHGLICGADMLRKDSNILGKFYIITDDHDVYLWRFINEAAVAMGFTDLFSKFHLPVWLLMTLGKIADRIGYLLNRKFKLGEFSVRMLIIHRYFSIENAKRDLKYKPIVPHDEAWKTTIEWFKINWLPEYHKTYNTGGNKKTN